MIKFNEVTWYSKLTALIFFVGFLPILVFYMSTQYQEVKMINEMRTENKNVPATHRFNTYTNTKYNVSFVYPIEWGTVSEQDEGNMFPTIRISKAKNCSDLTPVCDANPEITIASQRGYTLKTIIPGLLKQHIPYVTTTIDGFPALISTLVSGKVSRPIDENPYGYYKSSILNIEKPGGVFITVAFSGPLFLSQEEAEAYDISSFKEFILSLKLSGMAIE